jgi:catechol 2,3-dioxygenase-like lactoylglutathione lyase family enzyme
MAATAAAAAEPAVSEKPKGQQQTRKMPTVGTKSQEILLTKITVSDLVKSYEFYTHVIGLKLVTSPDIPLSKAPTASDPEKDFVEIPLNFSGSMADPMFLLIKQRGVKPSPESARMVIVGLKVENRKGLVERATQAGYKPVREVSVGGAQVSFIADPDGYTLEVFEGT